MEYDYKARFEELRGYFNGKEQFMEITPPYTSLQSEMIAVIQIARQKGIKLDNGHSATYSRGA